MDFNKPTKIILQNDNNVFSWETDHSDVTLTEIFTAFKGLLVAMSFYDDQVLEAMRDFANEYLDNEADEEC
jgi:hypothetical protein